MRDLIVLQRSRSLRDPSASPPAWNTPPSIVDLLPKKGEKNKSKSSRRLSALSGSSPVVNFGTCRVTPSDEGFGRRVKREESSRKSYRVEEETHCGVVAASGDTGSKASGRLSRINDAIAKTLSDQLHEAVVGGGDSDDVVSSNVRPRVRYGGGGMSRTKRRKFRGTRRVRGKSIDIDTGGDGKSEMSVASNSVPQGEKEGLGEQNMTKACGIPFNWSRIHHRGKTFLDKAGRSLSCGMSDSKGRKGEASERRNGSDLMMRQPEDDDDSSSFVCSDGGEALPLLVDSAENEGWVHDYSGELGIFADNLLKNEEDSDLASEGRSGEKRHNKKKSRHHQQQHQHQSLTEKYTPKTFRDLVGQNLVVQALSNAVARRKLGLLYVFHGPNGTGKTSCARIFARALNCHSSEQQKPCGVCTSCVSHEMGKSWNIREVGPVGNFDFENLLDGNNSVTVSSHSPRVLIFDDCDTLSSDSWSAVSKVVDRAAPRRVVFILVCSSLDVLPHVIISRCQKFFFPKLKDADIVYSLQWIASKEEIEIEKDALKLIASRSDGSLRDAEMTLEQLSLLGQRISVPLVQELVSINKRTSFFLHIFFHLTLVSLFLQVGLVSDEKLVDLLDLALSADTVNTVKNLRTIMETSVEPLALMSQLATVITDILAGSYDLTKDQHRRKFFRQQPCEFLTFYNTFLM